MANVKCPHCDGLLAGDERLADQVVSCPLCLKQMHFPSVTAMRSADGAAPEPPPIATDVQVLDREPADCYVDTTAWTEPRLLAGAYTGRKADCYCCGAPIQNGEPRFRRYAPTGDSSGYHVSTRSVGFSTRNYRGVRTVCQRCARHIDSQQQKSSGDRVLTGLAAALIVGVQVASAFAPRRRRR
jgi:hypothetical protein